jgi:excinuclease UvrABC ATPase subunit
MGPCPLCKGARLNQAALSSKINGYNIAELSDQFSGFKNIIVTGTLRDSEE